MDSLKFSGSDLRSSTELISSFVAGVLQLVLASQNFLRGTRLGYRPWVWGSPWPPCQPQ